MDNDRKMSISPGRSRKRRRESSETNLEDKIYSSLAELEKSFQDSGDSARADVIRKIADNISTVLAEKALLDEYVGDEQIRQFINFEFRRRSSVEVMKGRESSLVTSKRHFLRDSLLGRVPKLASVKSFTPAEFEKLSELEKYMEEHALEWDFDVMKVEELTGGNGLGYVTMYYLRKFNLLQVLGTSEETMIRFLNAVQSQYRKNPYHNATHAADVVSALAFFMFKARLESYFPQLEVAVSLIAAAIHDVAHPGTNNRWEVLIGSDLAFQFNDQSVLENYHIVTAYRLLRDGELDIFKDLTEEQRLEARELIVKTVLSTDMATHYDTAHKFKLLATGGLQPELSRENRLTLLSSLLHLADLSNPARPKPIALAWAEKVMEEFYLHGDRERLRGVPISRFYDRHDPHMAKCQLGFIQYVVLPAYTELVQLFPEEIRTCVLEHIKENMAHYSNLLVEEDGGK